MGKWKMTLYEHLQLAVEVTLHKLMNETIVEHSFIYFSSDQHMRTKAWINSEY